MRRNKNANYTTDARAKVGTLIGKDVVFDGNLSAPETVCIDGTVNGNCECKAQVIVGNDGLIKGDINAQNVLISGRVEGNVYSYGKIELLSTGIIAGNITSKSLVIDEGACFDGRCTMTNSDYAAFNNTSSDGTYSAGAYDDNSQVDDAESGGSNKKKRL